MEPLEDYGSTLAELGMTVTDSSDLTEPTLPTFAAWRARVEENESTLRDLIGPQGVEDFVGSTNVLESFWLGRDSRLWNPRRRQAARLERQDMSADTDQVRTSITQFLERVKKNVPDELTDELSLYAEGLGLDSLDAAELSAQLEDEFGSDPFTAALQAGDDLPETVGDIVAYYGVASSA
jgi:acyl carrier protein